MRPPVTFLAPQASAGFSLLEALIATSLLALLSLLLLGGVQLGTRVMDTGSQRAERGAALTVAYDFLRSQLEQAQPVARTGQSAADAPIAFDGGRDGVAFVAIAAPYRTLGGYQHLSINAERQGHAMRVLATWQDYDPTAASAYEPRSKVLLEQLRDADFAYFGATADNEAPTWHPEWRDRTRLPALVMLRVVQADGTRVPNLVVALRLAEPAPGIAP
jgi:general secretion pathway protein J